MELLLFKPTSKEKFALNVHKVREVFSTPAITKIPQAGVGIIGLISIRGNIMPVLDLSTCVGLSTDKINHIENSFCIVVECLKRTVALLVEDVDKIISVESIDLLDAEQAGVTHAHIEAIIKLDNDQLVSVLDLEALFIDLWGEPVIQESQISHLTDTRSILCVDDSSTARKSLNNTLTKLGYKIETLSSAKEAISKATHTEDFLTNHYIAWLIDAEMPGMDGFELIKKLKELSSSTGLPLYILTSMSGDAINEKSVKAGADGCLIKFDIESLINKLKYLSR